MACIARGIKQGGQEYASGRCRDLVSQSSPFSEHQIYAIDF